MAHAARLDGDSDLAGSRLRRLPLDDFEICSCFGDLYDLHRAGV